MKRSRLTLALITEPPTTLVTIACIMGAKNILFNSLGAGLGLELGWGLGWGLG